MKETFIPPNFRSSKKIEVIATVVAEGKGTDDNMVREVTYYSDLQGNLLAVDDCCFNKNEWDLNLTLKGETS